MDAIRPWLYIGRYLDTVNWSLLTRHQIGAMLQLHQPVQRPGIQTLYIAVDDGIPIPSEHMQAGLDFVLAQKGANRRVLIACRSGISRSVVFTVAALKVAEELSLLDALREVKKHHWEAAPHPSPWQSLCEFFGERVPTRQVLEIIRER